ncbi:MAG: porin family protein [Treponema sp.]|nr:porin family protein [Treponema sp.]
MKKTLISFFFILASFNICAQNFREAKIFVLPISGEGAAEDNSYFYKQLSYEVTAQFCAVVKSIRTSDYILSGSIEYFVCYHDTEEECSFHSKIDHEISIDISPEYIFYLELINTATNEAVSWQYILYSQITGEVNRMVSIMVYNMLSAIPDIVQDDDRRSSWLFAGAGVTWAPRIYRNDIESVYMLNFGFGAEAEFQFLDFMAISAGLQFAQDWILMSNSEYRDLVLEIPVAIKFVFKPANYYLLEPYGGVSYNISMMQTSVPSMLSWFAGFQFGVKAGPGFITIDPRFTMDFFNSRLVPSLNIPLEYRRYMIQISAGYKFGFLRKNKKNNY